VYWSRVCGIQDHVGKGSVCTLVECVAEEVLETLAEPPICPRSCPNPLPQMAIMQAATDTLAAHTALQR